MSRTSPPLPSLTSLGCSRSPHPVSRVFPAAPSADAPVLWTSARHCRRGSVRRPALGTRRAGSSRQSDTLRVTRQLLREREREAVSARLGARTGGKPTWGQPAWDWRSQMRAGRVQGCWKEAGRGARASTKLPAEQTCWKGFSACLLWEEALFAATRTEKEASHRYQLLDWTMAPPASRLVRAERSPAGGRDGS